MPYNNDSVRSATTFSSFKPRSESISAASALSYLSSSSSLASKGSTPRLKMRNSDSSNYYFDNARNIGNTSDYDGTHPLDSIPHVSQMSSTATFDYPTSPISTDGQDFDYRNSYATNKEGQRNTTIRPSLSSNTNASTISSIKADHQSLPLPPSRQQQRSLSFAQQEKYPTFPPTEEMKLKANMALLASEASFKVIYAGDAAYKSDKKMLNKTKRAHFVLTNNQLLMYKSSQKARSEINIFEHLDNISVNQDATSTIIDKDRVFLQLSSVYAVQLVATSLTTFRIEYLQPLSGQALFHLLTVDSEREAKQWVHAIRKAVCVHHPRIQCISGPERHAVLDRMAKQSDTFSNTNQVKIYKVVFKEKRYKTTNNGEQPKEVFLPVIMAIGKFSFYLLPISVLDDAYLKTVERDRFGVLSIQSICYDNVDDTVVINVKQVGKSNRQLAFASTFCEEIILHLYRSINSIVPGSAASIYEKMPQHIKHCQVTPYAVPLDPEDEITGYDDDQVHRFSSTLRGYAAAMNINKSRFNFTVTGPWKAKSFTLLPPHEVGRTSPNYKKYELLAILRAIQSNNIFIEICLAQCPLDELERWKAEPNHGWTFVKDHPMGNNNILSNEIYSILTSLKLLRKLDLTDCSIGKPTVEEPIRQHTAISTIGTVMLSGKTQLSRISVGKNNITHADLNKLIHGIKEHKKSIKELHLNECGLEKDMIEQILQALYTKIPDQIISFDLSSKTKNGAVINPGFIKKMIPNFKRLEVLRMRGYNLLNIGYNFGLETSRLRELDVGGSRMNSDIVARLCKWIQMPSFNCIKSLHLGDCNLNGKNVYDILVSISQSGNRCMHLNLEHNPIIKEVMHLPKLHSALLQGEGPKSISFAYIEWDDSALREFIDCLRDNRTITRLDLSDIIMRDTDEVSEDTVHMLTSFFERNTCLIELKLNFLHNKIARIPLAAFQPKSLVSRAIVQALPGLRHNASLQHLDISNLYIEDAGAIALVRVLKTNKYLQSIIIDENNISIEGYQSLTKVIEECATQVVNIPAPRRDLRYQLSYLVFRIEELIISESEAQFFLIHTSASDKKKSKRHELEMIIQERKKCELALQNFESVIHSLTLAVQKNMREFNEQNRRNMEFQIQAQTAAHDLAIAQLRLQGRSPTAMSGANLSAVGIASSAKQGSNASIISSTNSSVYSTLSRSASRNVYQSSTQENNDSVNQIPALGSPYSFHNGMVSPCADTKMYKPLGNNINGQEPILAKPHAYDENANNNNAAFQPSSMVYSPIVSSAEYNCSCYIQHCTEYAQSSSTINASSLHQHYQQHNVTNDYASNYFEVDDPGFISDFGYVDDFEEEIMIDPHYLMHPQKLTNSAGTFSKGSVWSERQAAQRRKHGLYLPPDKKD